MPKLINIEQLGEDAGAHQLASSALASRHRLPKKSGIQKSNQSRKVTARNLGVSLYDKVSLAGLKEWARKLPESSLVRELVFEMDDSMPRWELLSQMCILDKLLRRELKV